MKTTVRLTESALMLAASFVLSLIPVVNMPFGGSVTLASMLPLVLIAYRHGTVWGLLTAFAGSLLQLLMGLNNLSYAVSAAAAVAIVMLDYLVAFTVLGLAGIFRKSGVSQTAAVTYGTILCCFLRYACHFASGVTVWRDISIPADQAILYSLGYNAAYMVPETIITVAAAVALSMSLDFSGEKLRPAAKTKGRPLALVLMLVCVIAAAVAAVLLFRAFQTEDGFAVTAVTTADLLWVGGFGVLALIAGVIGACCMKKSHDC